MDARWTDLRDSLGLEPGLAYLNTGSQGPTPRPALERARRGSEEEARRGPSAPGMVTAWEETLARVRVLLAALLGSPPEGVALTFSTSHGMALAAQALNLEAGDEVILSDQEHSGGLLPWYDLARRRGVRLRWARSEYGPDGAALPERLSAQVAALVTPRTRAVSLSHVSFCTGARLPVEGVAAISREAGAAVVVDGAQSVGALPVDVAGLGCDFFAFPGQKWLLGPSGTGGLCVRPERLGGDTALPFAGYMSVKSYDLEGGFVARPAATRFEQAGFNLGLWLALEEAVARLVAPAQAGGGPAGAPGSRDASPAAPAFSPTLSPASLAPVAERSARLASRLKAGLRALPGFSVVTPLDPAWSAGLVAFAPPPGGPGPEEVRERLAREHRIVVRTVDRPRPLVRASLHAYNTEKEVDGLLEALGGMVGSRR